MDRCRTSACDPKRTLASAAVVAASFLLGTALHGWQQLPGDAAGAASETANPAAVPRDEVQRQHEQVRALREKLRSTQAELRSALYAAHMKLAQRSWEENDPARMRALLEQHRPRLGQTDMRGFEWYDLYRLCHAELLTCLGHTGHVHGMAYSPDGKRLASGSVDNTVKIWDAQPGLEPQPAI